MVATASGHFRGLPQREKKKPTAAGLSSKSLSLIFFESCVVSSKSRSTLERFAGSSHSVTVDDGGASSSSAAQFGQVGGGGVATAGASPANNNAAAEQIEKQQMIAKDVFIAASP